jgi:hypothetical protein
MTLKASRAELLAALDASGIRAFYGMGVFQSPCARVFPAEPWVEASGMAGGRRTQHWEIWAVAGKSDAVANYDELEELVQSINDALVGLVGWSHPAWRRPAVTDMGGTKYLACRGVVETLAEV